MTISMNTQIEEAIKPKFGKPCCRQRVWRQRSLSLGFGQKVYHGDPRLIDTFEGEWEMCTYYSAWRVIQGNTLLCGSKDAVDSIDELDSSLQQINLGHVQSLSQPTQFDVRAEFDNGMAVDFLGTTSDDDEIFYIFCPNKHVVTFSIQKGWEIDTSGRT